MAKITREEVVKIAQMSHISLHEDEIAPLLEQLENVLSYAERVNEVATEIEERTEKLINVMREDQIVRFDAELILAQAPEREEGFFVVPKILENNS